jgi:geranylgeranyl pyrophosphate synthase
MAEEKSDNLVQKRLCDGICARKEDRDRIRSAASEMVAQRGLVPPLPLEKLKQYAAQILERLGLEAGGLPFAAVVLSNALWRETVARIPFDKRLLLLPQCLKDSRQCTAEIDSLGLLCRHCGRCVIDRFTRRAEELGYAALVAEGSPVVMALIESGQVQATVGVSCLSVLERVFPYMEAGAVPGIAIPLLVDGCQDTRFDEDWLAEAMEMYDAGAAGLVDVTRLRQTVRGWFEPTTIQSRLRPDEGRAYELSVDWLCQEGKRYRPILTAGVYSTLTQTPVESIPVHVRQASLAVECFHKASLIHDDIEDNDATRYNQPTLHRQHGVAMALNAGDYLIGAGYRLLAELECPDAAKVRILQAAARCHRTLCVGQGEELSLTAQRQIPPVDKALEIFAQKTSPAFEAALKIGAILAGAPDETLAAMGRFSDAVGIAYQIRDDLRDARRGKSDEPLSILTSLKEHRPSLPAAEQAASLLNAYRTQAIESLEGITNAECKAFLRKLVTGVFDQTEPMECCDEYLSEPD